MLTDVDDYVDLATEQGWRSRRLGPKSYQLYAPDGKTIVTINPSSDWRAQANWKSQLRRAGLKFPEDERRKPKEVPVAVKPEVAPATDANPFPTLDELFAAAEKRIDVLLQDVAALESILKQLRSHTKDAERSKAERVRALMKELLE